jgi:hypothetical protein
MQKSFAMTKQEIHRNKRKALLHQPSFDTYFLLYKMHDLTEQTHLASEFMGFMLEAASKDHSKSVGILFSVRLTLVDYAGVLGLSENLALNDNCHPKAMHLRGLLSTALPNGYQAGAMKTTHVLKVKYKDALKQAQLGHLALHEVTDEYMFRTHFRTLMHYLKMIAHKSPKIQCHLAMPNNLTRQQTIWVHREAYNLGLNCKLKGHRILAPGKFQMWVYSEAVVPASIPGLRYQNDEAQRLLEYYGDIGDLASAWDLWEQISETSKAWKNKVDITSTSTDPRRFVRCNKTPKLYAAMIRCLALCKQSGAWLHLALQLFESGEWVTIHLRNTIYWAIITDSEPSRLHHEVLDLLNLPIAKLQDVLSLKELRALKKTPLKRSLLIKKYKQQFEKLHNFKHGNKHRVLTFSERKEFQGILTRLTHVTKTLRKGLLRNTQKRHALIWTRKVTGHHPSKPTDFLYPHLLKSQHINV